MDVTENDNGYVVHAEIPGVKKEDIQVDDRRQPGHDRRRGEDAKVEAKDGERVLRSERYYGSVYRSFTLPVELDEADEHGASSRTACWN